MTGHKPAGGSSGADPGGANPESRAGGGDDVFERGGLRPVKISGAPGSDGAPCDLSHLAGELEVLTQSTGTDIIERTQVAPLVAVLATQHRRWGMPLTCLMVGLKSTAPPNRKLPGDQAVAELARFMRRSSRSSDRMAFYLGDCIALLMSEVDGQGGLMVALRLVESWAGWACMSGRLADSSLAVGICAQSDRVRGGDDLLRYAYLALEEARHSTRGAICHHAESGVEPEIEVVPQLRHVLKPFARLSGYAGHRLVHGAFSHLTRVSGIDLKNAQRVADGALGISRRLGMTKEEEAELAAAALLRDIGMTQVPRPILAQESPLDTDQRRLIDDHPRQSLQSLGGLELPVTGRDIILHHHERFDGAGYPDRLAGDRIPLGSRLIAVVDAYEAMTTSRVYRREVLSGDDAKQELRNSAGTQFDPTVVDLFVAQH